jgi:PEP-CTERM motif-containing protein
MLDAAHSSLALGVVMLRASRWAAGAALGILVLLAALAAPAIDAAAGGFGFKTITGQASQGADYLVSAESSDTAQLSLLFSVGSFVGYGGGSLSPESRIGSTIFLTGGGANPATLSPVPEPPAWALMIIGFAGVALFAIRRARRSTTAAPM